MDSSEVVCAADKCGDADSPFEFEFVVVAPVDACRKLVVDRNGGSEERTGEPMCVILDGLGAPPGLGVENDVAEFVTDVVVVAVPGDARSTSKHDDRALSADVGERVYPLSGGDAVCGSEPIAEVRVADNDDAGPFGGGQWPVDRVKSRAELLAKVGGCAFDLVGGDRYVEYRAGTADYTYATTDADRAYYERRGFQFDATLGYIWP